MLLNRTHNNTALSVLRVLTTVAAVLSLQLVIASPAKAAPANDDFAGAVTAGPILPFSDTRTTGDATRAADDPSCAGSDGTTVWYRLSPSRAARVAVTTAGSNYDTTLSVYSGARGSLTQLGCNDDALASGSKHSEVVFDAVPGTTYHVMAASYPGTAGGTLVLSMAENGLPPATNDDFDSARAIATIPFTDAASTSAATTATDDPSCFGNGQSVWYRFTPSKTTRVLATTEGSGYDTTLSVFTGSRGSLLQVACSDNIADDVKQSLVDFTAQPGITYHVMAASFSGGPGGDLVLNMDSPTVPPSTSPSVSVDDISVVEGTGGTNAATFTVSVSAPSTSPVTVNYATANATATAPDDYLARAGTVTIPAGSLSGTVSVPVQTDSVDEADEHFTLELSGASGATIADGSGKATIVDDDGGLSVSDAAPVAEGTPGAPGHTQGFARFTVSLSPPAATTVTVNYATANGTATAGSDYTASSGTLAFAAGETSKVVSVPVTTDSSSVEGDEDFSLNLSAPSTGVAMADAQGKAVIVNDDPTSSATLSVNDVTVVEGLAGTTTQAIFTVKLSKPYAAPFTVRAITSDGTAHPSPHESNDYVHLNQILSFARDETTKQVAVTINGDNIDERDETFALAIEDSTGPQRDKRQGVGVITNDDGLPPMSINDVTITEGNAATTEARFTVSLAHPSFRQITVNYATLDGTARSTNHGVLGAADYNPASGTVTFAPGETTKTVVVVVNGDTLKEQDEEFFVNLSNNVNATAVKRTGVGTIRNDD